MTPPLTLFGGAYVFNQTISFRKNLTDVEELPELVDNGWRYLPLKQENKTSHDGLMTNTNIKLLPAEIFIWRTDNF